MKIFNKTHLPETITYNGNIYKRNSCLSNSTLSDNDLNSFINVLITGGVKVIECHVLSKKLKYKTDFHNNSYKPTKWLFTYE